MTDNLDPRLASTDEIMEKFARTDDQSGLPTPVERPLTGRYQHLVLMKGTGTAWGFTPEAKDRALDTYARSGSKALAAAAAGVARETIRQHCKTDEVFAEAWEDARLEYCARLEAEVHRRAVEGVREPLIGRVGKDEDGVIAYVRRYSDRLLEFQTKRHIPDYRERQQVDHSVSGGVLVVHTGAGPITDPKAALAEFDKQHVGHLENLKNVTPAKPLPVPKASDV